MNPPMIGKNRKAVVSDYYFGINAPFEEENLTATGDKVVLKKHERLHERVVDGIVIPCTMENIGNKMAKATVLSVGPAVEERIKVGSTVLYDQWSVFYDTHPIVITKAENIIVEVEKE